MLSRKIVKGDVQKIRFLYPEYEPVENVSILTRDKKVLYVGRYRAKLSDWLDQNSMDWISTVGPPDVELESRESLLKEVYGLKRLPESVLGTLEMYSEDEFWYYCKIASVVGRWPIPAEDSNHSYIFDLFKTLGSAESMRILYLLLENQPPSMVESSLLTFLVRASSVDEQEVNPHYRVTLKSFQTQKGDKVKPAVKNLLRRDICTELRLTRFLWDLK